MRIPTKILTVLAISSLFTLSASAVLNLTPADADFSGSVPNNPDASDVETITGDSPLTEVYKQDVGGAEIGSAAGSYTTTFANDPLDPAEFTIAYDGGSTISGDPIYLLVKDGNADPIWYIFDITGWDGLMNIEGTNFWPTNGAISHVSIFTGEGNGVPDGGATVLLLGLALTGISAVRRFART